MAVDKDLFLYDLAVVAVMKNEAHYVKEWLDYHLAAGVNHFYLYDNDSSDNFKEVLQPYIDAGIVTYKFYPGVQRQLEAYNEAFKEYRFFCRYMAFIDADEFIFPQSDKSIVEVADEILEKNPKAGGVEINWMMYGSNNLETADYSKGVLERFTRRANIHHKTVKAICNPRRINFISSPHFANYFPDFEHLLEENLGDNRAILVNHYCLKSREEYLEKVRKLNKDAIFGTKDYYAAEKFSHYKDNIVFDDSILTYRAARLELQAKPATGYNMVLEGSTLPYRAEILPETINYEKLINAIMENTMPLITQKFPPKFFVGKMETFLTCRALATYLKENALGMERGNFLERATLQAIHFASLEQMSVSDLELLLNELPNILPLEYPEVEQIRQVSLKLLSNLKDMIRQAIDFPAKAEFYREFNELDNYLRLLQAF